MKKNKRSYPSWRTSFRYDPIPSLLMSLDPAIVLHTQNELCDEETEPVRSLWEDTGAVRIIQKQQPDGSWKYASGNLILRSSSNYDQYETYKTLAELVEKYGFDKAHPAVKRAAEFLFNFQTKEGDFRGIYSTQYTPNYSAAIMEILIKAGYAKDARISKGFSWLESIRQDDGGWAIPFRTREKSISVSYKKGYRSTRPLSPDRKKPFSHLVTGVVLRAYAAHPKKRASSTARSAAALIMSRFFKPDTYSDRRAPLYWGKLTFPFHFTDILSALDSLSRMGYSSKLEEIQDACGYLVREQREDGLWNSGYQKTHLYERDCRWITLAVCRVFQRLHEST